MNLYQANAQWPRVRRPRRPKTPTDAYEAFVHLLRYDIKPHLKGRRIWRWNVVLPDGMTTTVGQMPFLAKDIEIAMPRYGFFLRTIGVDNENGAIQVNVTYNAKYVPKDFDPPADWKEALWAGR